MFDRIQRGFRGPQSLISLKDFDPSTDDAVHFDQNSLQNVSKMFLKNVCEDLFNRFEFEDF